MCGVERVDSPGARARYGAGDAGTARRMAEVARRPVRQISAFNGKNEGPGSSYRDAGRDWRDDRGVRERHHRRGVVFRQVVLGAVGGKRAQGVWITRPGPGGTRKGGNKAAPPLNRLSALPSWPNLRATIGSPEARAWGF